MSEYLDYISEVEDAKFLVDELAFKMYQQGRADERERIIKLLDNLKPYAKNKDVEYAIEYIHDMLRGGAE